MPAQSVSYIVLEHSFTCTHPSGSRDRTEGDRQWDLINFQRGLQSVRSPVVEGVFSRLYSLVRGLPVRVPSSPVL